MKKWKPKHRIYKGLVNLDTDEIRTNHPKFGLTRADLLEDLIYDVGTPFEIGIVADRNTGRKLGTMYQKNYNTNSNEYNRLGKTADQWVTDVKGYTDLYVFKDALKVKEIEEAKRNYNRSQSTFNGYELTDLFNKHVAQPIAKAVAGGAGTLWNNIKDKPFLMMTGDPSISYAGNAYYRTPAEQIQDVGNFFNHTVMGNVLKGLGNGVFSVLTPSKDLGVLTSIDNAIRNRDPNYIVAPWSENNYGLARYPDDKQGEALNTMVDIPALFIGGSAAVKNANKAKDVVKVANASKSKKGLFGRFFDWMDRAAIEEANRMFTDDFLKNELKNEKTLKNGSVVSQKRYFEEPETFVEPVKKSSKRKWRQISEEEKNAMTPEERLLAGVDLRTGRLDRDYLKEMDQTAGRRLQNGVNDPAIGYWDSDKAPVFYVDFDDAEYWEALEKEIEKIKEVTEERFKAGVATNEEVLGLMDLNALDLTLKNSPTAHKAFLNTTAGKELVEVAHEYGLTDEQIENIVELAIKDNLYNNAHAVLQRNPKAWINKANTKAAKQYRDYISKNFEQIKNFDIVGYSPYIVMGQTQKEERTLYSKLIDALTKRHEQGHISIYPTAQEMPEEVISSIKTFYKDEPDLLDYFANNKGTEIAQRFSQVKDLYLLKSGEKLTWDQFLYGLKNYGKLTGLDNNMTDLYRWAATIKDPKLQGMILGHFNNPKNAYSMFGPIAITLGLSATGAAATQ